MEARNISQELEAMIHSKRIPNALIFEADGSGTELEISLEFVKKLLLSKEKLRGIFQMFQKEKTVLDMIQFLFLKEKD